MGNLVAKTINFLGSFKLAFVLFLLLFWLTFWGTLAQADMALYDVQIKYFESIFVVYWAGPVPIPMLGGYLLLSILFVNLLVGGMLRMRFSVRTIGVVICHFGVLFLLVGSFIEFKRATKGAMLLYPGDESNEYQSHNEWEVAVEGPNPEGGVREYVIPADHFTGLSEGESTRYKHADLPFDVVLSDYARNSTVRVARPGDKEKSAFAEGFVLHELEPIGTEDSINRPGLVVSFEPKGEKEKRARRGVILGFTKQPYATRLDGKQWTAELRRVRWALPFKIRMKEFVHKKHAGTGMAKEFSSYVTKLEEDPSTPGKITSQEHHITMNAPMRHKGFTFYQSSWGPQDAAPGAPLFSQFAVVNNPTDRWPEISCWIIALGLLVHFSMKLVRYLQAEGRRRARAGGQA